ncbi:efflux RND transporter periplasmic adaptor subunit [uncultured Bacteroides sp.]|uniref:efflux RND transporter periplasmic adaptor subunit n=1 Tax=uncultured Bacteroides sp. TaxID=162156 RepID=UPI0025FE5348|nr:efflux RND transporter periplasmic adaptor subunit [uncultured Bacteroides sp.]
MKPYILLCLTGIVTFSCTGNSQDATEQEITVQGDTITLTSESILPEIKESEVQMESYQKSFTTSGVVKAIPTNYAEIASPFAGRITKTFVRLGQKVSKGSAIFEISSPDFFETSKTYYQTKQEMELALKSLKREKDLFANKVGVQKEVEEAEVNYELKKKDYENALAALKVFQIDPSDLVLGQPLIVRSPINGEVVSDKIIIGQYLKEDADPVAIIADLNKVWVAANVKEKDIPLIRSLANVEVSLVSMPDRHFTGTIYHINEMLDEDTRAVEVLIECDNKERLMKPAMYGTVKLTDTAADEILIPTSAILQNEDSNYVLVALGNHQYQKRTIRTAGTDGNRTVILSGLQPRERIISEGAFYLVDAR